MAKQKQPDTLFESLVDAAGNPRLQQSLERVKDACDALESSKVTITPTSVGRYCEERWSSPKAQSIRNAKDSLFAYIQTRRAKQVLPMSAQTEGYEPPIRDEAIRAYVALIKSERDEAIRLKNRIINGLRSIPGVPIDDLIASGFKPVSSKAEPQVSIEARSALSRLFDETALASVGLERYRNRLRSRVTKDVLLEKPDVEALLQLIRAAGDGAVGEAPRLLTDGADA